MGQRMVGGIWSGFYTSRRSSGLINLKHSFVSLSGRFFSRASGNMFMHLAGFRQFRLPVLSLNPKASKISQHAVSCLAILVDSQMLMAMSQDTHMDQLPHHGLPSFIAWITGESMADTTWEPEKLAPGFLSTKSSRANPIDWGLQLRLRLWKSIKVSLC